MDATLAIKDPIAPQLFAKLRLAIVEMSLHPGKALSEKDIADRFGVSRQPVREAFIKLSEAGLLQILPNRGTFVVKISVREVANARFVREAVEVKIARRACEMANAQHFRGLAALIEQNNDARLHHDQRAFSRFDDAFHRGIADIVDCDYAWRVVEGARAQTDRIRFVTLYDETSMALVIEQHRAVLDAMISRNPDEVERAMRRHLSQILLDLPKIAEKNPELFEDFDLPVHSNEVTF